MQDKIFFLAKNRAELDSLSLEALNLPVQIMLDEDHGEIRMILSYTFLGGYDMILYLDSDRTLPSYKKTQEILKKVIKAKTKDVKIMPIPSDDIEVRYGTGEGQRCILIKFFEGDFV